MLIEWKRTGSKKVLCARDVFTILNNIIGKEHKFDQDKEHFYCIGLSRANKILYVNIEYIDLVSLGSLTATVVSPLAVYRFAILKGSAAIIIAHNHPSGNLLPSDADKRITTQLKEAGIILDIKLIDHVIFTTEGYYSFAEEGLI